MNRKGYTPYCGADKCSYGIPRTVWSTRLQQFKCPCGWCSSFETEFIDKVKKFQELK